MEYIYDTVGTCCRQIKFNIDGDTITKVQFLFGGCPGNLQALPRLVEGMKADEIIKKLEGIDCAGRGTSCADQLARAIKKALQEMKAN